MGVDHAAGYLSLIFCTRNAFAAWVYRSAAFSYFSVRPPNQLKPPEAPDSALSAYFIAERGHGQLFALSSLPWSPCKQGERVRGSTFWSRTRGS